jgi:hypothetical protein
MNPITATAIPDGTPNGAGLEATMARTTANDFKTAPMVDDMKMEFLRLC